ncbi:MAG: peptidylprolyl isomerase [Bacteroidales bacterium]|nr:peptidylprolyl isomerase [Bacteroidales bacterium]
MKKFFVALFLSTFVLAAHAQDKDPVVFEISGDKVTASQFKAEFLKSMGHGAYAATLAANASEKRKVLNNYADLYINFRLKLKDAFAQGIDTLPTLVKELALYRKELAMPYLIDSATMSRVLHEAYQRNQEALQCNHILIRVDRDAKPEDTLKAYMRSMKVYERVTTGGEDFIKVAKEVYREEAKRNFVDPQVVEREEPYAGQLPNFTVFDMIYPFENAAYSLKEGEISKPVRTKYGYHVIQLLRRSPYFGSTSLQHIWVSNRGIGEEKAKEKIEEAYDKLQKGNNFSSVAASYSDDKSSANSGGLMPSLPLSQMPPEYVPEISMLKTGEYSKPFKSQYGWHIIYVVNKESIPPFESMEAVYKQRMSRDAQRGNQSSIAFARQLLTKYATEDYTQEYVVQGKGKNAKKTYKADLNETMSFFNDTLFRLQWHYAPLEKQDKRPIFRIEEITYTNDDLLRYIEEHQRLMSHCDPKTFTQEMFETFKEQMAINYADNHLESDYPEFKALVNEYREGLMIFAYNEKNIWSQSIIDTLGFQQFYARESVKKKYDTPEDSNYFWHMRAQVRTVHVSDSTCLPRSKALKVMEKQKKKNSEDSILQKALEAKVSKRCDAERPIQVDQMTVEKGNQNLLSSGEWQEGIYARTSLTGYRLLQVLKLDPPTLKSIMDARGYYISDFQNYLEQQLIENLKAKYGVVKHQNVLDSITY